jgi:membrane-bound metal-dependent hydrolase YbcI (DUF457 family)
VSWAAHELESYVIQKHMKARVHVSYLAILLGCYVPDLVTKWVVFGVSIGPIDMPAPKDPWKYHRGWPGAGLTHSLTFGFLVAFFVLWKFRSREWFLGLLVGTAAHVLTDAFDSVGTMLFFPFTTQHYTTGMWAYAAQQGANGDGAAYYSGPGGAWDLLWLVIALFNWRVLTRKYFWDSVVPDDPAWGWVQRKLRLSDATLLALYRAYFYYGACRIFAWFFWARWIEKVPLDLSWGGPGWVNKVPGYDFDLLSFTLNTVVGAVGLSVSMALLWRLLGRRWWDRALPVGPGTSNAVPA